MSDRVQQAHADGSVSKNEARLAAKIAHLERENEELKAKLKAVEERVSELEDAMSYIEKYLDRYQNGQGAIVNLIRNNRWNKEASDE